MFAQVALNSFSCTMRYSSPTLGIGHIFLCDRQARLIKKKLGGGDVEWLRSMGKYSLIRHMVLS